MSEKPTILAVDDERLNLDVLVDILRPDYRVLVAKEGATALARIAAGIPDLILLDVMMPGMDGYEVCRRIKADPASAGVPVIFITALGAVEDEARGFGAGAVDYITKPFSPVTVRARVRAHLELKAAYDRIDREIESVARLQRALLPRVDLDVPGFSTRSIYLPSGRASGDAFDYFPLGEGRVRAMVADVSGHGARAAVVMALVRTLFRLSIPGMDDLASLASFLNDQLLALPEETSGFVSLFALDVDRERGEVAYVNAGHCPAVFRIDGRVQTSTEGDHLPLGLAGQEFSVRRFAFGEDFSALVYTDGLYEWRTAGDRIFGIGAFLSLAARLMDRGGFDLDLLMRELSALAPGGLRPEDDVTGLLLTAVRA